MSKITRPIQQRGIDVLLQYRYNEGVYHPFS
jgi:hypothetical protein